MQHVNENGIENVDIDWIYTPLEEAKGELDRRRKDLGLIKRMKAFSDSLPFPALDSPKAILSRPIATPNYEFREFLNQAESICLKPLVLEYPSKLVMRNKDKYYSCNLHFSEPPNKKVVFPSKLKKIKIIDIPSQEGKVMRSAETFFKISLSEFHRDLIKKEMPNLSSDAIVDFTEWFDASKVKTEYYYLQYLSLFICQGILFENFFWDDPSENKFLSEKILPSFKKSIEVFGVKPLVVRLLPDDYEKAKIWLNYPSETARYIEKKYGL